MTAIERIEKRKGLGVSACEMEFLEMISASEIRALGYCPLAYSALAEMLGVSVMTAKNAAKRLLAVDRKSVV